MPILPIAYWIESELLNLLQRAFRSALCPSLQPHLCLLLFMPPLCQPRLIYCALSHHHASTCSYPSAWNFWPFTSFCVPFLFIYIIAHEYYVLWVFMCLTLSVASLLTITCPVEILVSHGLSLRTLGTLFCYRVPLNATWFLLFPPILPSPL